MRKLLAVLATVGLLMGGCPMMGCSFKTQGMMNVSGQIRGAEPDRPALNYSIKLADYDITVDGDPASFIERVLDDGAGIVKKVISLFGPPVATVGV